MSADKEILGVDLLKEESDWPLWKFEVRIALKSTKVFEVVNNTELKPVGESEATQKLIKAWEEKDTKAQRIIMSTISKKSKRHLVNCISSNEMWSKLHSVYEQKSETGVHFLQQKFFSFEKSVEDDIVTYISKLEEIAQQLKDLNEAIPDSMIVTKILLTLPSNFNHFHSAWESTESNKRTLDNLRNRLMIEEKRLKNQDSAGAESEALLAKRTAKKHFNKKENKKGVCFKCGQNSHWKKDCPLLANQGKTNQVNQSKSGVDALCCEALLTVNDKTAWFFRFWCN